MKKPNGALTSHVNRQIKTYTQFVDSLNHQRRKVVDVPPSNISCSVNKEFSSF